MDTPIVRIPLKLSSIDLDGDGVIDFAEAIPLTVRNNTGVTIAKGAVVYITGAIGQKPTIALAKADAEATSSRTLGVVVAAIANNTNGVIITTGRFHEVDTSTFVDGDLLYLSDTVAGGMTTTRPVAPNHAVFVGYVAYAHGVHGILVISIQNGHELEELHNVLITAPADTDLLSYETVTGLWKNIAGLANYVLTSAMTAALALKANLASPTFTGTVGGITAAMVGAPSGSGTHSGTSSGTNTGDQTSVSGSSGSCTGNAASATDLNGGTITTSAIVQTAATTHTMAVTTAHLISTSATTCTVTLPAAASYPGKHFTIKKGGGAGIVVSASANVVPLYSVTAGTDILNATQWCTLVSNGTHWVTMQRG